VEDGGIEIQYRTEHKIKRRIGKKRHIRGVKKKIGSELEADG